MLTGLWSGSAQLDQIGTPGGRADIPSAGVLALPILIHVDATGRAVLLKEVVILVGNGPTRLFSDPAAQLNELRATAPEVLATSHRLQSVGFDFNSDRLPLTGTFDRGGIVTGRIEIAPDARSNPFFHRFHPDHDNRDATGALLADGSGVPAITRTLRIEIASGSVMPGASFSGEAAPLIGAYSETISGLAAEPIRVSGRLVLTRVIPNAVLE